MNRNNTECNQLDSFFNLGGQSTNASSCADNNKQCNDENISIDIDSRFIDACIENNIEMVKYLLKIKPTICITKGFEYANEYNNDLIVEYLLKINPSIKDIYNDNNKIYIYNTNFTTIEELNNDIEILPNNINNIKIIFPSNAIENIDKISDKVTHLIFNDIGMFYTRYKKNKKQPIQTNQTNQTNQIDKTKYFLSKYPKNLRVLIIGETNTNDFPKYFLSYCNDCGAHFGKCYDKYYGKYNINNLPEKLEILELGYNFACVNLINLPKTLKQITISGLYNGTLDYLPDSIINIKLISLWYKASDGYYSPNCIINRVPIHLKNFYVYIWDEWEKFNFNNIRKLKADIANIC